MPSPPTLPDFMMYTRTTHITPQALLSNSRREMCLRKEGILQRSHQLQSPAWVSKKRINQTIQEGVTKRNHSTVKEISKETKIFYEWGYSIFVHPNLSFDDCTLGLSCQSSLSPLTILVVIQPLLFKGLLQTFTLWWVFFQYAQTNVNHRWKLS